MRTKVAKRTHEGHTIYIIQSDLTCWGRRSYEISE